MAHLPKSLFDLHNAHCSPCGFGPRPSVCGSPVHRVGLFDAFYIFNNERLVSAIRDRLSAEGYEIRETAPDSGKWEVFSVAPVDEFTPHLAYALSNAGGIEIEIAADATQCRTRDWSEDEQGNAIPNVSRWKKVHGADSGNAMYCYWGKMRIPFSRCCLV